MLLKWLKHTRKRLNGKCYSTRHNHPDIALSDYYLIRSMTNSLAEQHFQSDYDTKKWVDSWIASKDEVFFRRGICMLPERWEKVVASDKQYFE